MNIAQAFIGELLAMVGYGLLCTAVYKLFQVEGHLVEIKALLQKPGQVPTVNQAALQIESDSATEYAQKLLRAVNAESRHGEGELKRSTESLAGPPV